MATLPRLFIDKLQITIAVSPEQQNAVDERLANAFPNVTNLVQKGRYRRRCALTATNDETIEIEWQPTRSTDNFIKLTYEPENLGDGTALLADYLLYVLGPTYRQDFQTGIVKQMTVVWELNNVLLDDLWVSRFRGQPKRIALISNAALDLKEIQIGAGSERQVVFSQQPSFIRGSYNYGKGDYALGDLFARLENPLISLTLRRYASMLDLMDETQSRLLFDALRLRGKERVLAMYPEGEARASIESAIKRFPLLDESMLRLKLWGQLRERLTELMPAQSD